MEKIIWNLPNEEAIIDRIEELEECLQNFPESKMTGIWRSAIDQLKHQLR